MMTPDFLSLLQDEQLQQLMLVACPDGVVLTDAEDRVVLYTGACESLFDWAPVEMLGRKVWRCSPRTMAYAALRDRLLDEVQVTSMELVGQRKGGEHFPASVSACLLRDRYGDVLGSVLYVRDHSELQRIQGDLQTKNEQLNEMVAELDRVAHYDHLTGLMHRGSALAEAESALVECGLGERPFGVALFDLDGFKSVNDSHGHLTGDQVLATLAGVLRSSVREGDIAGRFGGEEFVVFLPGASLDAAYAFAERVRSMVERATVDVDETVRVRTTISAGVASIPGCEESLTEAIRIADERMLIAKRRGRNRVVTDDDGELGKAA
ncbi:MAG: sensor domain-containing diguanylate cyclase [Dehalococcoidia bacterium]|nr:sensor domain-containing diguanylate cyclase [Dehalococcoidia bacterium]